VGEFRVAQNCSIPHSHFLILTSRDFLTLAASPLATTTSAATERRVVDLLNDNDRAAVVVGETAVNASTPSSCSCLVEQQATSRHTVTNRLLTVEPVRVVAVVNFIMTSTWLLLGAFHGWNRRKRGKNNNYGSEATNNTIAAALQLASRVPAAFRERSRPNANPVQSCMHCTFSGKCRDDHLFHVSMSWKSSK
jgi:hypothetical protein